MPRNRPTAPTAIGLRSRMPATSRSGPTSRSPGIGTPSDSATIVVTAAVSPSSRPRSNSAATDRRGNPVTRTRTTRSPRDRDGAVEAVEDGAGEAGMGTTAAVTAPLCGAGGGTASLAPLARAERAERLGGQRDRDHGGGLD